MKYTRKEIPLRLNAEVRDLEWVMEMIMNDMAIDEILEMIKRRKRAYEYQAGIEKREWRSAIIAAHQKRKEVKKNGKTEIRTKNTPGSENESLHINNRIC